MDLNLAKKSIRDTYKIIGGIAIASAVWAITISAFYPAISKATSYIEAVEEVPRSLIIFFGGPGVNLRSFEGWISLQFLHFPLVILGAAVVISLGIALLAEEFDKGTIELLFSLPISRSRVFLTKAGVIISGIALTLVFSLLGIYASGAAVGVSFSFLNFFLVMIALFFLLLAIAGLVVFLAVSFGSIMKTLTTAVGIFFVLLFINIVGELVGPLNFLKYLSIFHYYQPFQVLKGEYSIAVSAAYLLVFATVFFVAAYIVYTRRDIPAP